MIIENRKARFNYEIILTIEAGIELKGNETKSILNKKCSILESYISIVENEAYLKQSYIKCDDLSYYGKFDETRDRKLLLHKKEIMQLKNELKFNNHYTIVPLDIHLSNSKKNKKIKLTIALVKGKNNYDKRQSLKEKDIEKQMKIQIKGKQYE